MNITSLNHTADIPIELYTYMPKEAAEVKRLEVGWARVGLNKVMSLARAGRNGCCSCRVQLPSESWTQAESRTRNGRSDPGPDRGRGRPADASFSKLFNSRRWSWVWESSGLDTYTRYQVTGRNRTMPLCCWVPTTLWSQEKGAIKPFLRSCVPHKFLSLVYSVQF